MAELRILSYIGLSILLLNAVIYLLGFAKQGKAYRCFALYLIAIFGIQSLNIWLGKKNINNHFLSSYYLFFQFVFLSCFFYFLFDTVSSKIKTAVKYISIIITIMAIGQYIYNPALYYTFNPLGLLITTCTLVAYSVVYLLELISKKLPFHYVVVGIFIYLISSSLIFVSAASIVSFNVKISMFIWKINALLFIAYQLLILWEWKQTFYLKPTKQD
ncbi:hypothetical protein [Flavobacterium sp. NRK1]|uniref:hypothetical protein n=1 Tax=Flavobacterium sp. NRK1 TaxID=2954929 RepID=UPI002093364E|nr:hypothetical protein [Flavobacterium sp. NRK1]MCO6149568.1 hypothetical protein [Flavobacterium sp. NRK1]